MNTIKGNIEKEKGLQEYKRTHGVDPWRATGQTSRALFDLASRYPDGEYYFVCHSGPMRDLAMRQFIEMQVAAGAPITVNNQQRIVKLHSAMYKFKVESNHMRANMNPDATVIEDHHVGEVRREKVSAAFMRERERIMKEEKREKCNVRFDFLKD